MINKYLSIVLLVLPTVSSAHVHRIQNSTPSTIAVNAILLAGPTKVIRIPPGATRKLDVGGYLTAALTIEGLDGALKGVRGAVEIPDPKFSKYVVVGAGRNEFVAQVESASNLW